MRVAVVRERHTWLEHPVWRPGVERCPACGSLVTDARPRMTAAQRVVYELVVAWEDAGRTVTYAGLGAALELGLSTVWEHVQELRRKGYLAPAVKQERHAVRVRG